MQDLLRAVRERMQVTNAAVVMRVEADISISENPSFQFYYVPDQARPFSVSVFDTAERRVEQTW